MRTSCGLYCGIVRPRRVIIMIMHCAGNRSFIKRHKSSATFLQFSACHGDMHQTYPAGHVERCILREYLYNTMHIYIYIYLFIMLSYDHRRAHCARTFYTDALLSSNLSGWKKFASRTYFYSTYVPRTLNSIVYTRAPSPLILLRRRRRRSLYPETLSIYVVIF